MPIPSFSSTSRPKYTRQRSGIESLKQSTNALPALQDSTYIDSPRENRSPTRLPLPSTTPQGPGESRRTSFLPQAATSKPERDDGASERDAPRNLRSQGGTHARSTSSTVPEASNPHNRLRPTSMYQKSASKLQPPDRGEKPPTEASKQSEGVKRSGISSASGLSRSQSLRKPASSTSTAAPATTSRLHARHLSTNTVTRTTQKEPSSRIPPSPKCKAPSLDVSYAKHSTAPTNALSNTRAGAPGPQQVSALKRSTSTKTRVERLEQPESRGNGDSDQTLVSSNTARRRDADKDESKKQIRPAFSTLQQHFTPRKTGKALTSTFIHPPAPDISNNTLSSDVLCLQTELLQLHLLHEASAQAQRRWERSAEQHLQKKFDDVAGAYRAMRDNERQVQEQKNLHALREWRSGNSTFGLAENIQLLSAPLHELPTMADSGGRFARLVGEFETWMEWVNEIWTSRAKEDGSSLRSAEELGDAWKAENAALTRKLTAFKRDMETLTEPAAGSSVALIVSNCRGLLEGMLEELQVMLAIESDVVERERAWIEDGLQAIAADIGNHLENPMDGNEAWRR